MGLGMIVAFGNYTGGAFKTPSIQRGFNLLPRDIFILDSHAIPHQVEKIDEFEETRHSGIFFSCQNLFLSPKSKSARGVRT